MNRRDFVRHAALGAAALALPLEKMWAAAPDFDHDPIQTVALGDPRLRVLMGMGGNITLLSGPEGVLQFDSGVPSRGADVLKTVTRLDRHPAAILVNTHWHYDHTGGNGVAAKSGARILAHQQVYTRLSAPSSVDFFKSSAPAYPVSARPAVTFTDALTLHFAGEAVHLQHVAPAHTDSDLFAHLPGANIVVAGDLFFNGLYPFIDYSSGGNIGGMIAGVEQILALADSRTRIVPGHGPVGGKAELQSYRDMLATVQDVIAPLKAAGKTEAEVGAARPTAALDARWGKGLLSGAQFTTIVYRGLPAAP